VALSLDGTAFQLPYGAVKTAVGAEYQSLKIDDTPPADSITGNLYNYSTSAITRGSDKTISAYAEAEVPILRNLPFVKDLTLNASGRFTHYRSYGDGWTYKVNGLYSPVSWLTLRATYGTSFRAPSLKEQFQGSTAGFVNAANDPCNGYNASSTDILKRNCAAAGLPFDFLATTSVRVNALGGAAAGLKSETSSNLTIGGVIQPDLGRFGSLKLSVDYYNIKIQNAVDRAGYSTILNNCYNDPNFGTAQAIYCRLITRTAGTNALTVNDSYINVATQKAAGVDIQLRYTTKIGKATVTLDGIATRYTSQAYQQFSDQDPIEYNGTIRYPQWTGDLNAKLAVGKVQLFYKLSYVQGQDSNELLGTAGTKYQFTTPDYFLHGASIKVKATSKFDIVMGMNNIFNTYPPTISSGYYNRVGNAPLYSGYDFYGRSVYANVTAKF
jgi:iron complex outermembrane receptor protein